MEEKKLKRGKKNNLHVQRHVAHHLHSTLNLTVSWKWILGQLRLSLKQLLSLSSRAPVQIQYNIPEGFMCALTSLLKMGPYLILNSHLSLVSRSMFLQDKSQYCMYRSSAFITLCCCWSALALLEGCCMSLLVMHSVHPRQHVFRVVCVCAWLVFVCTLHSFTCLCIWTAHWCVYTWVPFRFHWI